MEGDCAVTLPKRGAPKRSEALLAARYKGVALLKD